MVRDGIKIKLAEQTAAQLASRPIAYDTGFTLPPGTYTLKFLARENETGKMGTYETKFTIPDLAPDRPALKTSSVVWSNQRQPLTDVLASAENKKKLIESDPLVQEGQKLVPSITHVFRKDQNLYVYLEVYDPGVDAERKKPSVAATLSFYRGKTKTFESQPVRLDEFAAKRGQTLPVRFQAPLAQLAAGRYTCQINIVDETGRKFTFARTEIVVLPKATVRSTQPEDYYINERITCSTGTKGPKLRIDPPSKIKLVFGLEVVAILVASGTATMLQTLAWEDSVRKHRKSRNHRETGRIGPSGAAAGRLSSGPEERGRPRAPRRRYFVAKGKSVRAAATGERSGGFVGCRVCARRFSVRRLNSAGCWPNNTAFRDRQRGQ